MQQDLQMRWIYDPFVRRRINDSIIRMAERLAPELLRRMPADQPIDAQALKEQSIHLASTIVAGFQENDLI